MNVRPAFAVGVTLISVLIVVIVVLAVKVALREPSGQSSSDGSPTHAASSAPVGPPLVDANKQQVQRTVNDFVASYFSRDAALYRGSTEDMTARFKERLRPLVTQEFIDAYIPPLDTPSDVWAKKNGVTVSASVADGSAFGHFDSKTEAEQELTVRIDIVQGGKTVDTHDVGIYLMLVEQNDAWLVSFIEEFPE